MSAPIKISYSLANLLLGGGAIPPQNVADIFHDGCLSLYGYPYGTPARTPPADANAGIPLNGDNGIHLTNLQDVSGYLTFNAATGAVMLKDPTADWTGNIDPAGVYASGGPYGGPPADLTAAKYVVTFFRVQLANAPVDNVATDTAANTTLPRIQGLVSAQDGGAGVLATAIVDQGAQQVIDEFRIALPLATP